MRFSPIDPLDYAMMGTRAFALMLAGDNAEAAGWAERAACSSGRLKQSCTAPRGWLTASLARGPRVLRKAAERCLKTHSGDFLPEFPGYRAQYVWQSPVTWIP